jgi:hypothetical protein
MSGGRSCAWYTRRMAPTYAALGLVFVVTVFATWRYLRAGGWPWDRRD